MLSNTFYDIYNRNISPLIDALSQAEKDTGSVKNSIKTNSRQGRKKPQPPKVKTTPSVTATSPRPEKEKTNVTKTPKAPVTKRASKLPRE